MKKENVSFYTENLLQLAGELYLPAAAGEKRRVPGIVLCQGLSGVKEKVLPEIADRFTKAGFAALAFDYRGFGESQGDHPRLRPRERAADARAAISFLLGREEIDPARIGLYGLSYGATVAPWVAAFDRRLKTVIAVSGSGNGREWMRSLRTPDEWMAFQAAIADDRIVRAGTGKSRMVPLTEIIPFSEQFWDKYKKLSSNTESSSIPRADSPGIPRFPLSSAEAMMDFAPDLAAGMISPQPILFIHGEKDDVCPVELTLRMFARCGEPKKIIIIDGLDHIDLDHGDGLKKQVDHSLDWFRKYL